MKFKYRNSDNVLVCMGSDVGLVGVGEVVEDTTLDIPSDLLENYTRTSLGVFTRKNQADINTAIETESNAKKVRKRHLLDALATLTGLTRKQVLKCFVEIVKDQNDD